MPTTVIIVSAIIFLAALIYIINMVLYKNLYYKFLETTGNEAWFDSEQRKKMNGFLGAIRWILGKNK